MSEEFNCERRRFLAAAAVTFAAAQFGVNGCGVQRMTREEMQLPVEGELPSLGGTNAWLNSEP